MAAFEYVALGADGKKTTGIVNADSVRAASKELRLRQLMPIEILETDERKADGSRQIKRASLKHSEQVLITRQLAMLIGSGSPVEQAIAAVASQSERPSTRRLMSGIRNLVAEGYRFSDALPKKGGAFPPLYRSIVASGETSGDLGAVLERLAVYLEKAQAVRRKIQSALIYPTVLSVVAIGVIILLMSVVVPRVIEQFNTLDADLPALTSFVIGASNFLRAWGLYLGLFTVAAIIGFRQSLNSRTWKKQVDGAVLKIPVIGKLVRTVNAARFARTFSTLLGSGATVLESMNAAKSSLNNLVFVDAVSEMISAVSEGGSISASMRKTETFPAMLTHLAASGEMGGNLGLLMEKGADYLEDEFDGATTLALGLLEPLIILFMGGVVAVIVLSIMLPILQLNSLITA